MAEASISGPIIAATATLVGTVLGTVATIFTQRSQRVEQRRFQWDDTRRRTYSQFLAACNYQHYIVRGAILREVTDEIRAEIEKFDSELLTLSGEINLMAGEATRKSASALSTHVTRLAEVVLAEEYDETKPSDVELLKEYIVLREEFRENARKELRLS